MTPEPRSLPSRPADPDPGLTHLCKLLVGHLQPGHVLLVQVVAAHSLRQRPDVHVAQRLGARRPDQLLWSDKHDLLLFLCQRSAQEPQRRVFIGPLYERDLWMKSVSYLTTGCGMDWGLTGTWTPFSHSCLHGSAST